MKTDRVNQHLTIARVVAAIVLAGGLFTVPSMADGDGVRTLFESPPASARPWIRWWWPGDAVSDQEIRREVDVLKSSGFGGGEVTAFNPGIPDLPADVTAKINAYATPDFFAHVAVAADEAQKQGLDIDYAFETGYPAGGGTAITPALALSELAMSHVTVRGPDRKPIRLVIPQRSPKLGTLMRLFKDLPPGWQQQIDARQKIVAVVAVKGTAPVLKETPTGGFVKTAPWDAVITPGALQRGTAIVLTSRLRRDGTLAWKVPPGEWQIFVFKQNVADTPVAGGVGTGPQFVLDHLDKDAFLAHAKRVGGAESDLARYFGHGERAIFIDSLELMPDLYWSDDFLKEFKTRRGYDLTPYLPLIVQPGWMQTWGAYYSPPYYEMGDLGDRIRADYHRTVSELIIDNFWKPAVDWAHERNLLARMQPMGSPSDYLQTAGLLDIPETEDLGTGGDPVQIKEARSAADIYGRDLVSAESFCWIGKPFAITTEMLKRRADLLFASGINEIVAHGFTYKFQADKWPGWFAFMPKGGFSPGFSSMLNEADPLWSVMPSLTAYITRTQAVLQATRNVVPVAYYVADPTFSPGPASPFEAVRNLVPAGYDFDYMNDDGLMKSHIEGHQLVTPGGSRFSVLVLPKVAAIRAETAEKIADFAKQGLPVVIMGAAPTRDEGFHDYRARDARVRAAMASAVSAGARVFDEGDLIAALHIEGIKPNLRFENGKDVPFVEKEDGTRRLFFLYNDRSEPRSMAFAADVPASAQLWDTWTGRVSTLQTSRTAEGVQVALTLQPNESVFLVFGAEEKKGAVTAAIQQAPAPRLVRSIPVKGGWNFSATGHGANGRVVGVTAKVDTLKDWKFIEGVADLSGTGTYRTTVSIDSRALVPGARILLDLGMVHDAATVTVNSRRFAPLLFHPYVVDVTDAVRKGRNAIEVDVVNAPQNAMVAGTKLGEPAPAGLAGPVVFRVMQPGTKGATAVPLFMPGQDAVPRVTYTLDTPLGELLRDPKARVVLQKYVPDLVNGRTDASAANLSLRQIQAYAPKVFTDDLLQKIGADLGRLNSDGSDTGK